VKSIPPNPVVFNVNAESFPSYCNLKYGCTPLGVLNCRTPELNPAVTTRNVGPEAAISCASLSPPITPTEEVISDVLCGNGPEFVISRRLPPVRKSSRISTGVITHDIHTIKHPKTTTTA